MAVLRIWLFGSVRVSRGPLPRPIGLSRASQTLLAYLVLHRARTHSREALAALLWPEAPTKRARDCLNTALWRLRRVLEPNASGRQVLSTTTGGDVMLRLSPTDWLDVAAFEDGVVPHLRTAPTTKGEGAEALEGALSHFTDDLCPAIYDEWASAERERLRLLYLRGMARLLRYHEAAGRGDRAIACGRRILALDPLREEVHRDLMRLHLADDDRSSALRQFEECRRTLERELGVAPMPETLALRARAARPRTPSEPIAAVTPSADPSRDLQRALCWMNRARRELRRAIQKERDPDAP